MKTWYAVQETREDAWDYGSHDKEKAIEMLREQGHGLIAVINEETNYCEDEIWFDEIDTDSAEDEKEEETARYWLDTEFNYGDFSKKKYALHKVTVDEDGDEVDEIIFWGFWEEIEGYGEYDFPYLSLNLDEKIEKELGFLPEYDIN